MRERGDEREVKRDEVILRKFERLRERRRDIKIGDTLR